MKKTVNIEVEWKQLGSTVTLAPFQCLAPKSLKTWQTDNQIQVVQVVVIHIALSLINYADLSTQ